MVGAAMTDDRNELVESVVRMQLSNPNFAEYCVAHVTDPKHRFLFVDDNGNTERRLYVRLLQGQEVNKKNHTAPTQVSGCLSSEPNNNMKDDITAMLWASLLDYFASPAGVYGPHMPHMFRSEWDLTSYLEILQHVEHSHESRERVLQYMMRRMPMTETFLYTLWYLCDLRTHGVCKSKQTRNANTAVRSGNGVNETPEQAKQSPPPPPNTNRKTDTSQTQSSGCTAPSSGAESTGDDSALKSAATLLFVAAALLLEQEAAERPGRYRAVFDAYIPRMVERLARATPRTSQVALYLRETVSVWAIDGTFTGATLQRMQHAVG